MHALDSGGVVLKSKCKVSGGLNQSNQPRSPHNLHVIDTMHDSLYEITSFSIMHALDCGGVGRKQADNIEVERPSICCRSHYVTSREQVTRTAPESCLTPEVCSRSFAL